MKLCTRTILGFVFGLLSCAVGSATADEHDRPNFVVILCDDLGYGDLGCFGHAVIQTPNLDRLAAEGIKLTACYASAPVCSPSRAGMLTGRTPYRSGIYDWIPAGSPMHLMRKEITIATLLKSAGYATCFSGKWHCNGRFNSPDQPQPGDHGFEHWFATQNNAAPSHRHPTNFVRNGKPVGPLSAYSSTVIVDEACGWLEARKPGQPFCLFVWFHSPHEPVATADDFVKPYADNAKPEEAIYFGNVAQTDHEVGRLLKKLDELKLRDNTFVFFTSDNGPEGLRRYKGAGHSYGSAGPLRDWKLHLYEGGIRVPGILRWPDKIKPGRVSNEPVVNTDLLPTLCAITGVTTPADRPIDGVSFLPILDGKPMERKQPMYWQYDKALGGPKVAIRQGDWKLLADGDLKKFELYNLRTDWKESADLAAKEPARVQQMSESLRRLHREIQAEGPKWPEAKKPE